MEPKKQSLCSEDKLSSKDTVYEGKRNIGYVSPNYQSSKTQSVYIVNSWTKKKIKVKAGTTFYVQVTPYDNYSSGYYTLKWK